MGQYSSGNYNASIPSGQVTLIGDSVLGWNGSIPGPTIYAVQGQTVSLNLISNDTFDHQFFLDVNNDKIPSCLIDKCSPYFDTTIQYSFQVNIAPGTYNYYCALYRDTMHGWFVVLGNNGNYNPSTTAYSPGQSKSGYYNTPANAYGTFTGWMNSVSSMFADPPTSATSTLILAEVILVLAAAIIAAIAVHRARSYLKK